MQIVIDIPEKDYEKIKKAYACIYGDIYYIMQGAIANGTPLPKHGRLIDADKLREEMEKDVRRAMSFVDLTDFVWLAPTIIEADKEE